MAKKYTGSLTLEWFNKNRSIITQKAEQKRENDIPAPRINWINKDEALFYEISAEEGKGLTPYWVDRNDIRVKESRPLVFQKAYRAVPDGEGYKVEESDVDDPEIENILIKGDNLLTLNTLKKMFDQKPDDEKVKCIYIDPPYNTGSALMNDYYSDNMENSEWLTLMRDRVQVLKSLLMENGYLIVQIDDKQYARLYLLLSEFFGQDNLKTVCVKMSEATGVKMAHIKRDGGIAKLKEYLIIAGKNGINDIYLEKIPKVNWDNEYKYVFNGILKEELEKVKEILEDDNRTQAQLDFIDNVFKKTEITTINKEFDLAKNGNNKAILINNSWRIFRDAALVGSAKDIAVQKKNKIEIDTKAFAITTSQNKAYLIKSDFNDETSQPRCKILFADQYLEEHPGDIWLDIPTTGLEPEGGVNFPKGKKPEKLISRIIKMCTSDGDLVLDSFGGSGTTAATAHKLNRKWLSIELGNHCETHIIKRMVNVLTGKDSSGISKLTNWRGGGSFKYYHLGESIISVDKDGYGDFNWSLGRDFIEKSLLATYDYILDENSNFPALISENSPKVGFFTVNNYTMAGVVSLSSPNENIGVLDNEYILELIAAIREAKAPQSITIFTNRGIEMAWESKPEDVEIIKVPHAIFAELER